MKEIRRMIIMFVFCLVIFAAACWRSHYIQDSSPQYEIYTVEADDTIWSIASNISEGKTDVREIVDRIKSVNAIDDSIIYAGDKLVVPVAKSRCKK